MSGRFENRVVLITGGASGIGAATARRVVDEGGSVVVADRDADAAARVAGSLEVGRAEAVACDVTRQDDVAAAVSVLERRFGRLDAVVGNAGVPEPAAIDQLDTPSWERAFDVNVRGDFFLLKHALPLLGRGDGKAVVLTASVAGLVGMGGGQPAYSASKGAVVALTRALALELGGRRIRVNAVCPGWVRTPMLLGFYEQSIPDAATRSAAIDESERAQLLGRYAEPEEVAAAIAFLASDDASYITGVALPVDGGFTSTVS